MSKTVEERLLAIENHIGLNRGRTILKTYNDGKKIDLKYAITREEDGTVTCTCASFGVVNQCKHVDKYNKGE